MVTARRRRAIPAVTLWRPWTACFTDLPRAWAKRPENRGWATKHRGLIYLHGGKRFDPAAAEVAARVMAAAAAEPVDLTFLARKDAHPTGIVAIADLTGVCSASASSPRRKGCDCGPWAFPGQHHWLFGNVVKLPNPLPCNGSQQLWEPAPDVDAAARAQLADAAVCRHCLAPAASTCCPSHPYRLCHSCHRRTHGGEVCVEGCTQCAAEDLPLTYPPARAQVTS